MIFRGVPEMRNSLLLSYLKVIPVSRLGIPAVFAVCLLLFSSPPRLHAQALSGIAGTVTDSTGAVVPDAKVTVTNTATGVMTQSVTSSVGTYTITDLIPGTYTVKIEKPGFQIVVVKTVNVE